jgi:pimeloyl-ACP methyl ester carboxylesterase
MTSPDLQHRFIEAGGLRFHMVEAGPADGPAVLLLHGFPDFWIGWRAQIEALSTAGFRVLVPDQRGYNASAKPLGIHAYALARLVGDVAALADALDLRRFHLVGHDWGGIVAWAAGTMLRDRIERLAVLNAPHPEVLFPYALRSPTQFLRSSYAAFFQFPWLPEALLGISQSALLARALERSARPGTFPPPEIARYRESWQRPGALTAMLNWYRALRYRPRLPEPIEAPVLVLWGMKDQALEAGLARASLELCRNGRLETFPEATHWLQREEPEAVNAALIGFLRGQG